MNNAVDRLSGLPSPLLDHILSFLPTKDVVRTCVLSKTWRNVWCYVPSFHFDGRQFSDEEDFVEFVESALFLRDGSNIRKLHLTFDSKDSISNYTKCRANKWMIYAVRHHVEVLEIFNLLWKSPFELTSQIFTCKSLRTLKLTGGIGLNQNLRLMLPASCCLPSLKFLHFGLIMFMDVEMTKLESSAFPSLEILGMQNCLFQSNKLYISFPQLKYLNYKGSCNWLGDVLQISADTPNLRYLKLEIPYKTVEFVEYFNAISLVNANINLRPCNLDSSIKLIRALERVKSLTLHVGNLMANQSDLLILASIQTPFYNMKRLKIETSFSDGDVGMINTLLKHSTELETLFLEHKLVRTTTVEHRFEAEEVWFNYNLPHLKLVEIQGFRGSENEVKLTRFILENAIVLEILIIATSKSQEEKDNKQLKNTGRNLLASPRSSPSVGILFE